MKNGAGARPILRHFNLVSKLNKRLRLLLHKPQTYSDLSALSRRSDRSETGGDFDMLPGAGNQDARGADRRGISYLSLVVLAIPLLACALGSFG